MHSVCRAACIQVLLTTLASLPASADGRKEIEGAVHVFGSAGNAAHLVEAGIVAAGAHGQAREGGELGEGTPALRAHARDALQAERPQLARAGQRPQRSAAQLVRLQWAAFTSRTLCSTPPRLRIFVV